MSDYKKHISEKVCECEFCTKIDIMWGDPKLTTWERNFIKSVGRRGWFRDYSEKEKAVLKKLYRRLYRLNVKTI